MTGRPKPSNTVVSPSSSPPGTFLQSLAARSKEKRLYSQALVDSTAKKNSGFHKSCMFCVGHKCAKRSNVNLQLQDRPGANVKTKSQAQSTAMGVSVDDPALLPAGATRLPRL